MALKMVDAAEYWLAVKVNAKVSPDVVGEMEASLGPRFSKLTRLFWMPVAESAIARLLTRASCAKDWALDAGTFVRATLKLAAIFPNTTWLAVHWAAVRFKVGEGLVPVANWIEVTLAFAALR